MPLDAEPLAHSAVEGKEPQTYADHIGSVLAGGRCNASEMLEAARRTWPAFQLAVEDACAFHDLGKLDEDDQLKFREGPKAKLTWDHVDAGVAHAMEAHAVCAAWIIRGHHFPGLPAEVTHFSVGDDEGRRLRGRRDDTRDKNDHDAQKARTDRQLPNEVAAHEKWAGARQLTAADAFHGLPLRLALSCLVDADHTDTAWKVQGIEPPTLDVKTCWRKRRIRLNAYIKEKQAGNQTHRNGIRGQFFEDCRNSKITAPLVSCEGPVGIGKTTAVMAYLLKRAEECNLRRIIVVAPYTNILTQIASVLRDALCLENEDPEKVVMEHHHRAEFEDEGLRGAAVTWKALIVVTTAVQFFETLSANTPAMLRKLHQVPGSAIFIDEAHAALPAHLWRQYWLWLKELAEQWNCPTVLASGSLGRFWTDPEIVSPPCTLPDLVTPERAPAIFTAERHRVQYCSIKQAFVSVEDFCAFALAQPGPRVIVLNTLQNAALVARHLSTIGHRVHHVSTALCPPDRARVLSRVIHDIDQYPRGDWTLVGTSCIEAGLDLSFRSGFRERFGLCSLLQTAGRVNRGDEYKGDAIVFDFALLAGNGITSHPAADIPSKILREMFKTGDFDRLIDNPADLVTHALHLEINRRGGLQNDKLHAAECERDYPGAAKCGRVISSNTMVVIVKPDLQAALVARQKVGFRALLDGSVQVWPQKVRSLSLQEVIGWKDVYYFPLHQYDSERLGIMKWILSQSDFVAEGGAIL